MRVTIATIVWGLLVIGYFASTITLAVQAWGRAPGGQVVRRRGVVFHLKPRPRRRASRAA